MPAAAPAVPGLVMVTSGLHRPLGSRGHRNYTMPMSHCTWSRYRVLDIDSTDHPQLLRQLNHQTTTHEQHVIHTSITIMLQRYRAAAVTCKYFFRSHWRRAREKSRAEDCLPEFRVVGNFSENHLV